MRNSLIIAIDTHGKASLVSGPLGHAEVRQKFSDAKPKKGTAELQLWTNGGRVKVRRFGEPRSHDDEREQEQDQDAEARRESGKAKH